MQYREAAVRISQTIRMINRELAESVGYMFDYENDGKVSTEEADAYFEKIQLLMDKLFIDVMDPICERYPDLRPKCRDCKSIAEGD